MDLYTQEVIRISFEKYQSGRYHFKKGSFLTFFYILDANMSVRTIREGTLFSNYDRMLVEDYSIKDIDCFKACRGVNIISIILLFFVFLTLLSVIAGLLHPTYLIPIGIPALISLSNLINKTIKVKLRNGKKFTIKYENNQALIQIIPILNKFGVKVTR